MHSLVRYVAKVLMLFAVCSVAGYLATLWSSARQVAGPSKAPSNDGTGAPRASGLIVQESGESATALPHRHEHGHGAASPIPAVPAPPTASRDPKQDPDLPGALLFGLKGALQRKNAQAEATYCARLRSLGPAAHPAIRAELEQTQDPALRQALAPLLPEK